jgi:hypothetical protein
MDLLKYIWYPSLILYGKSKKERSLSEYSRKRRDDSKEERDVTRFT